MASDATIRHALRGAVTRLDSARVSSPALTARLLLERVTGRPREWLLAHDGEALAEVAAFERLLARVEAREPLAYVLGRRAFFDLDLLVDPRVLIPRPETELLVELALEAVAGHPSPVVIDVGTGSGAAAIAIARHAPRARVIATDVSADALDVARANAARNGVANLEFTQGDLLDAVPGVAADVIVANLPYVAREEIDALPPEIQAHEPRVALDGGGDGLDLVRRLLAQIAARHDAPRHAAYLEIGASQGPAALSAARDLVPGARAAIKQDLARLDRVLALTFGA